MDKEKLAERIRRTITLLNEQRLDLSDKTYYRVMVDFVGERVPREFDRSHGPVVLADSEFVSGIYTTATFDVVGDYLEEFLQQLKRHPDIGDTLQILDEMDIAVVNDWGEARRLGLVR